MTARDRVLHIGIDARPLSHPHAGGFKSYVRGLVRGLSEAALPDVQLTLFVDRPLAPGTADHLPPDARVVVLSPNRIRADLQEFRRALRRSPVDLLHGTQNYAPPGTGTPTTVTIHDAFGLRRGPWEAAVRRTPRERFIHGYWKALTRHSARTARRVVTISQASASDLAQTLGLPPERLSVVYNCASVSADGTRGAERVPGRILALASPDPRKDPGTLYAAMAALERRLPEAHLSLVCATRALAERECAAAARHGARRVVPVIGPDDAALAHAYATATGFAFPSWAEGFGAPPLEAMAAGCPVASSSAPALPEILGSAAVYFTPGDSDACADALHRLLTDADLRADLTRRGRAQAALYSPLRMAQETAAVWRDATRGAGSP